MYHGDQNEHVFKWVSWSDSVTTKVLFNKGGGSPFGAEHEMLQYVLRSGWNFITHNFTSDDKLLLAFGSQILHVALLIVFNGVLALIYRFGLFQSYRINGLEHPSRELVIATLKKLTISNILTTVLLYYTYDFFVWLGLRSNEIPSDSVILFQLLCCVLIEDFGFYWSHRLLHHRWLYKRFHKQHHDYKVCTRWCGRVLKSYDRLPLG